MPVPTVNHHDIRRLPRSLVAAILCLALATLGVSWLQIESPSPPAGDLRVNTADEAIGARAFVIDQIFGEDSILSNSSRSRAKVDCDQSSNIFCGMFDKVADIEALTVTMEFGLTSLVTLVTPMHSGKIVTIYHRGHAGPSVFTPDFTPSVNALLKAGHTVAIIAMPLYPPNEPIVTVGDVVLATHDDFEKLPRFTPSAELKFFLQPVFQTVEDFSQRHPDWQIQLAGLSGGGWTTVLAAAIDSRIDRSVSIAGSMPITTWTSEEDADREQTLPGIAGRLDYQDLYVLMTYPNRNATLVYNTHDPCCFAPGETSWAWEESVRSAAGELGGTLNVLYQQSDLHDIGQEGLGAILLNSARN